MCEWWNPELGTFFTLKFGKFVNDLCTYTYARQ